MSSTTAGTGILAEQSVCQLTDEALSAADVSNAAHVANLVGRDA
jgi:hypothetical protein